jgi:hypothetical protein
MSKHRGKLSPDERIEVETTPRNVREKRTNTVVGGGNEDQDLNILRDQVTKTHSLPMSGGREVRGRASTVEYAGDSKSSPSFVLDENQPDVVRTPLLPAKSTRLSVVRHARASLARAERSQSHLHSHPPQKMVFRIPKDGDSEKIELAINAGLDSLFNLFAFDNDEVHSLASVCLASLEPTDDNNVRLAKEEGYIALKKLSNFGDIEYVKAEAIWTLAILAALPRNHRKIIKYIGWSEILSYASTTDSREIGRATATLLGNLALYDEHHKEFISHGGLQVLVSLGRRDDIKTKRAVANALANIAIEDDNVEPLLEHKCLDLVFQMIRSTDTELLRGAVHTLANITTAENERSLEVKETIIQALGWERIIELMQSPDLMTIKGIMVVLANFASSEFFHADIIENGIIEELLTHTKIKDVEVLLSVAIALNNLASNPENHPAMIQKGAVKVLEKLYASRDQDIHQEAAEALFELHPESINSITPTLLDDSEQRPSSTNDIISNTPTTPTNNDTQMNSPKNNTNNANLNKFPENEGASAKDEREERTDRTEIVSRLVRSLHREPPAKVENTLKELRAIIADEGVAAHNDTLISGNCIGGLIQICSSMYSPAQIEATITIRELIQRNAHFRHEVFEKSGLPVLVANIMDKDKTLQRESLRTLLSLVRTVQHQNALRDAGAVPLLMNILKSSEDVALTSIVLEILCRIAHENLETQKLIIKSHGMDKFMNFLSSKSDDIKSKACRALSGLCSNNRRLQVVAREKGVVEKLVFVLSNTDNIQVKKNAAACIADLTKNDYKNQTLVRKLGGVPPIIHLLMQSQDSAIAAATAALNALAAGNRKIQKIIRENGGIRELVRLLQHKNDTIVTFVTETILELIQDDVKNQDLVCEAGVAPLLLKALTRPHPIPQHSLAIICFLAKKKGVAFVAVQQANI